MSFAERIKEARLSKDLTQEELARLMGVMNRTICSYELGYSIPTPTTLTALMDCLQVDANFLYQDEMSEVLRHRAFNGADGAYAWGAPIISAYSAASHEKREAICNTLGIEHVEPFVQNLSTEPTCEMLVFPYFTPEMPLLSNEDYERREFRVSTVPSGADFGILYKGDSMLPTIRDESIVFIRKRPYLEDGEIGIFKFHDQMFCRRFYKQDDLVVLKADNKDYSDVFVNTDHYLSIIGQVLGY